MPTKQRLAAANQPADARDQAALNREAQELAAEQRRLAGLVQEMLSRNNKQQEKSRVGRARPASSLRTKRMRLLNCVYLRIRCRRPIRRCRRRHPPLPAPNLSAASCSTTCPATRCRRRPRLAERDSTGVEPIDPALAPPDPEIRFHPLRFDDVGREDAGQPSGPMHLVRAGQGMAQAEALLANPRLSPKLVRPSNRSSRSSTS